MQKFPFPVSRFTVFQYTYRLILGDTAGYLQDTTSTAPKLDVLLWFFFVIGSFVMVIVMLNLLISIISDTYDQVVGASTLTNNFERALIINEYEKSMDQNERDELIKTIYQPYLFIADCPDGVGEIDSEPSDRIRAKIEKIDLMIGKIDEKISGKLGNTRSEVRKYIEDINLQNEEMEQEISTMKSNSRKTKETIVKDIDVLLKEIKAIKKPKE